MTLITHTPRSSRKQEFLLILRLMTKKWIDGCVNGDIVTLQAKEVSYEIARLKIGQTG